MDAAPRYRALSAKYGFSPQTIAGMTLAQQMMYLEQDENTDSNIVEVETIAEARALINKLTSEQGD